LNIRGKSFWHDPSTIVIAYQPPWRLRSRRKVPQTVERKESHHRLPMKTSIRRTEQAFVERIFSNERLARHLIYQSTGSKKLHN
jgi:hypothetical protein